MPFGGGGGGFGVDGSGGTGQAGSFIIHHSFTVLWTLAFPSQNLTNKRCFFKLKKCHLITLTTYEFRKNQDGVSMSKISGFVLAAGEGRRLRPATLSRPKALVPFCGVPLLELASSALHETGMNEIVVNAYYQGDRVYEASRRLGERYGWDIRVSSESKLLNQGGGLREGVKLVPDAEHILVHNVDVILDYDLKSLVKTHLETGAAVTALIP